MKKINKKCEICNSEIDEYNYYVTEDGVKYFCSENCAKKAICDYELSNKIYNNQICKAYDYCKQLNNNIEDRCKYTKEITKESYTTMFHPIDFHIQCQPSQISMILGNMKLYEFVKKTEEDSKKLNEETLKLTKENICLARAMLFVSIVNLILIIVQLIK